MSDVSQSTLPEARLLELMRGYRLPHALYLAVQLGIADLIATAPRSAAELAADTGCNTLALTRLLRALASSGIFVETAGGVFGHSAMSELLRRDHPDSRAPSVLFLGAPYTLQSWSALAHSVRNGTSAFEHVHGVSKWRYHEQHPADGEIFDQVMAGARPSRISSLLQGYDFSAASTVVDVGGGHGQLLAAVLARYPTLRGVLYDLPSVLRSASALLDAAGVAGRCRIEPGSFFERVPSGDTYILSDILHDWPDAPSAAILRACRSAMAGDGRLLVVEYVLVPGAAPPHVAWLDLQMLVEFGEGRQRSVEELRALFTECGFQLESVRSTCDVSVVVAAPC